VGSPLPRKRYGPVTTEPQGEASITTDHRPGFFPDPIGRLVNLRSRQYAGPQQRLVDLQLRIFRIQDDPAKHAQAAGKLSEQILERLTEVKA
jgi:hypothetical protein